MKKFSYVVKDEAGIHARPAGILVKEVFKQDYDLEGRRISGSNKAYGCYGIRSKMRTDGRS